MPLAPLATTDDVAATLNRALTANEATYAPRLLALASGMVRRYTRQEITATAGDVVTLSGTWNQTIILPQRPVTAVISVVLNGANPSYNAWKLIHDELFIGTGSFQPDYGTSLWGGTGLWGPSGSSQGPQATGATWQGPQAEVVVTYDHGYTTVPDDIVNEVAGMVALQLVSPVGVDSEMVGGYKVAWAKSPVGGMSLTAETKSVLNFYRRRNASVTITARR
jgi:hypothetical protein